MPLPRIRGITEAIDELRAADPKTALTVHALRSLVKTGELPSVRAGNKYLINMAVLEDYLTNPKEVSEEAYSGLCRVK